MTASLLKCLLVLMAVACPVAARLQLPNYQLNKVQEEAGLRTADVINMARDKQGFLWIATQGQVQQFDGRHTVSFRFSDVVNRLLIDAHNRKWVMTRAGVLLFDDAAKSFKQVSFEALSPATAASLYQTNNSVSAFAAGRHFIFNEQQHKFTNHPLPSARISRYFGDAGANTFFGNNDSILVYRQGSELTAVPLPNVYSVTLLNERELLVSTRRFQTYYVNIDAGVPTLLGSGTKDPIGDNLVIHSGLQLKDDNFLLSSNKDLLQYNARSHTVSRPVFYTDGRPLENQQSITSLYKDETGDVYLNHADGIYLLNSNAGFIQYFRNYSHASEKMPDNDVRNFAEDEDGNIWMATTNGIAQLNMQTGRLKSFDPVNRKSIIDFPSYRQLLNDGPYLWIGTSGNGVWRYNKQSAVCERPSFAQDSASQKQSQAFNNAYVWEVLKLSTDTVLVVGGSALFIINARTMTASQLPYRVPPAISRSAIQDASGRIWLGTTNGLACFDAGINKLFAIRDSFPDKRVAAFCEWKRDHMLIGSKGLYEARLQGNRIVSFQLKKGFPAEQFIYCMKQDKQGIIWLGTGDGIIRYDPVKEESVFFDRSDNVQSRTFNSDGAFLSSAGIMFMGGKNGVNYFDPAAYSPSVQKLQPLVSSFTSGAGNVDFIISAPEFKKPFRLQYRYRLRTADQWVSTGFNNQVRISKLQPGNYQLQVSASYDGSTWFNSSAGVAFTVPTPWWQTWWFSAVCAAGVAALLWALARYRRKRKEAAEMKRTVEYFTYAGTADNSVGPILWDITSNCISRLGFEDCVIYLLDEEKKVLVQKAAYGAKSQKVFEITNPIEIPVGQGITGHVAKTARPLIVRDTSKDDRYIVDDEQRFSEITVPIIHDGKVIGVIDSEHRRKNFFTPHHLKTLETISSLCASRIATATALEAARKAESELLTLNGKMTESKFMNLRLQMNPHFLFNILTTIKYLIVSKQVNKAVTYLDIFSGFLRALLSYAEATVVTLDEELRILDMYVELESLCLDETFAWHVDIDEAIDREEVLVPFMLLQPFVENAINHGLVHKIGEKRFCITIREHSADSLICIIEDNGIGRNASNAINQRKLSGKLHQSKGIGIVEKRLELLQQKTSKTACVTIEDLYHDGQAAGTRVSIIIPYYSTEEI
jgi:ligand-binding sensor domain-containing protein/putative methionine-R-sulfoxide reductase with GAF domain